MYKKFLFLFPLVISISLFSQENESSNTSEEEVEEIVTVGSQIKGAKITGALPVTVFDADDIEATAAVDGDELVENLVEQGLNFFNEVEQTSGGVNAARGDVGAYNIRSMGVGNTLTLLNGRRLVMNAGYQTEYIGGDFVPTMTVNTNMIPTNGLDRLEVLKDGASAIYGADAVAGVVNNVIESDYEGTEFSFRQTHHEHFDAVDNDISFKHGVYVNDGATNISLFMKHRDRERIEACEDYRWCLGNYEELLPAGSPWFGKGLDNRYGDPWYQIDLSTGKYDWADSADQAEMGIIGLHEACNWEDALDTGFGTCLYSEKESDLGGISKAKQIPQQLRDYRGDLSRTSLFVFINHEMKNGNEAYAEISTYRSRSDRNTMQGSMTSQTIYIPADYYWFSQLPDEAGWGTTKSVEFEAGRPYNRGRHVFVDKKDYRLLFGLRGTMKSGWDFDSAIVYSKARAEDRTADRIIYQKLHREFNTPGLSDTALVFNIFDPNWETNNGHRIFGDVYRNDSSTLAMVDFKMSKPDLFELPAGPVAALVGLEYRKETYIDDRDPYLDGSVPNSLFRPNISATKNHPYTSGVVGSSPTSDVMGDKNVQSLFVELSIPVSDKISAQVAARHEEFSDSISATVGKIAIGYDVTDKIKFRASASTSFRPPNLVQVNQKEVARTGSRVDAVMQYGNYIENDGQNLSYATNSAFFGDYYVFNSIRYATGAENLVPEESTNASIGLVLEPLDNMTITLDRWSIEKENTIGLFGRSNQSAYDLLLRKRLGIGGATTVEEMETWCKANVNSTDSIITDKYIVEGSSVLRDRYWGSSDDTAAHNAVFLEAGICPTGEQDIIRDEYLNLATRTVEGTDIAIYYDLDTSIGDFKITFASSITDKFEQEPIERFNIISEAVASGELPAYIALEGYGDLLGLETTGTDQKDSLRINYRRGDWGGSLSALRLGELYDSGVKLVDGTMWKIDAMTTVNLSAYKKFELAGNDARVKFVIKNVGDERAPLADGYLGFYSDIHRDLGRNYYLDLRVNF